MVKQFFKPDIYHELYEVDVYSNGNKNNSVYQYYRNMIPNNLQYPPGGTAAPGQHNDKFQANDLMNQGQQAPPQNPNNVVAQQIVNNYQQQQKKPAAASNQVISIDDDDEVQAQPAAAPQNNFQQSAPASSTDAPIIPSEMEPIGEPNVPVDQSILKDIHNNLNIENISLSGNYPTILDDNNLAG